MKLPIAIILIFSFVLICSASGAEKLPSVLGTTLGGPINKVENEYAKAGDQPLHKHVGSVTYRNLLDPFKDAHVISVSYHHNLGNLYEIVIVYDNKNIFLKLFLKLNPEYSNQQVITGASAVLKGEASWEKGNTSVLLRKIKDGGNGATILKYRYKLTDSTEIGF